MALTLLIVDDHQGFRGFARDLLAAEGLEVVGEAEDGASALAEVERLDPDVVLLDVVLPGLDGFEVCERLTHRDAERPAVVLTSSRDAASYVRRDVDSPMETRLRMLIVLAGLPEPQVNLKVRDDGEVIRKYDLSYPAVRVAIEYNGKVHVLSPGAWEADLERRHAIDDDGWRLVPVISSGIFSTPEQTLRRIHRVLLARRLPGVPTRLSDEWRAHFPGHADAA